MWVWSIAASILFLASCSTKTIVESEETYPSGAKKIKKKEVTKRKYKGDDEIVRTRVNYKEYHENGKRKRFEKTRDINRIFLVDGMKKEKRVMIRTFDERGRILYKYTKGKNDESVHKYVNGRLIYVQVMQNGKIKKVVDTTKEKMVRRNEPGKIRN